MDLLLFIFIWPILIFIVALLFIILSGIGSISSLFLIVLISLLGYFLISNSSSKKRSSSYQLEQLRKNLILVSIAAFLPIFVRYLVDYFDKNLGVIILGLAIGFGATLFGMFIKNNKVLMYSNIFGGALVLIYVYSQLWQLGELPRIIAAAFGLLVAVVFSVIKLKDKIT